MKALESGRSALKKEMSDISAAKKARSAYLRARTVNNRFADQQG